MPNPTPINDIIARFPAVARIANENLLNMDPFPVFEQVGDAEIIDCDTHLEIAGEPIDRKVASISINAFDFLFNTATNLKPAAVTNYLTGLKINYGVTTANEFSVIYQAVCLRKVQDLTGLFTEYKAIASSDFIYDSVAGAFLPAANRDVIAKYPLKIKIKHLGQSAPGPYEEEDATSLIFPFQEIYALIIDNPAKIFVDIYNSIRKTPIGGGDLIQHAMLLSPQLGDPLVGVLSGKYANRANLCPPDCNAKFLRA